MTEKLLILNWLIKEFGLHALSLFTRKELDMNTIKILTSNEIISMEYFSIKESDKILTRVKELSEKFETLDKGDTNSLLDVVIESQYLNGKLEGMRLVIEELERIAKISWPIIE